MKLSRLLLLAGAGVAIGYLLTRTEKGNELRKNVTDRAGDWAKKLRNLRDESASYAEDFLDDATTVAKKARKQAQGNLS
ncbi:MAG TPA: YtxH domain-containing protein [Flavipsychrobacter sp.]|nr:YtxH domain-containing protein [Flavipsychrobacter sp.]